MVGGGSSAGIFGIFSSLSIAAPPPSPHLYLIPTEVSFEIEKTKMKMFLYISKGGSAGIFGIFSSLSIATPPLLLAGLDPH